MEPPEIITGDNYESGRGVRKYDLFGETGVHINIFNISKINSEVRGGKSPRIKRLQEYIGHAERRLGWAERAIRSLLSR